MVRPESVVSSGTRPSPKKAAGTIITFCGGCMEAKISWPICNCYIPTAIGKSTAKSCREEKPRPARGVREGLSRMRGKLACPVLRGRGDSNASLLPDSRAAEHLLHVQKTGLRIA